MNAVRTAERQETTTAAPTVQFVEVTRHGSLLAPVTYTEGMTLSDVLAAAGTAVQGDERVAVDGIAVAPTDMDRPVSPDARVDLLANDERG